MSWIPFAFVRIVLFFIGGIMLYLYQPAWFSLKWCLTLIVSFSLLFGLLAFVNSRAKQPILNPGFAGLLAIFLLGFACAYFQTASNDPHNIVHVKEPIDYYTVVVNQQAAQRDKSWKVTADIKQIKSDQGWRPVTGQVLLYFSRTDFSSPPTYGDCFLIRRSPRKVQPPANPGEFDYQRFLSYRQIYHQHYLRAGDVLAMGNEPPSVLMKTALEIREWADHTLKKFIPGDREQNIATALVLGVTDGLDDELLQAYANTGLMHVLAVSGLHISIIYWIILLICRPLNKFSWSPWLVAAISIFTLWTYAFITGLSPSVLRAVTMFSFFALAKPWNKSTNIYNTLAVSAFCLLVYDPYLVMSVGFQLSYLAVLGIVYLQPALYRLWEPEHRWRDEVWKITSVSIAAQLSTFALGLFYFHQFPVYFLISNLLVIPGSLGVLVVGLVVLAVSFFTPLAAGLGTLLSWFIKIINGFVFLVEEFPLSVIDHIHITALQCWLLLGLVVSFILLIERRKFSYVWAIAGIIVIFSAIEWQQLSNQHTQLVVYKIPGHTAVDLIDRGSSYLMTDLSIGDDPEKIRYHIQPNHLICTVNSMQPLEGSFVKETEFGKIISFKGKTIVYWDKAYTGPFPPLKTDYLIVGNNAVSDLPALLRSVTTQSIIFDSSNTLRYASAGQHQLKDTNVKLYSVLHEGAFQQTLDL